MASTAAGARAGSGWIEKWNPEDKEFWESEGKFVARRNLIFSIFAEFLGFSVWQLFSIVGALLPTIGFAFSTNQVFWLVALPGLVGATMRFPYTFAVGVFGGRNWTIISALLLLLPTILLGVIVQNPETPYWLFAVSAALGGLGGGNFSSSMANINYFYPSRQKGRALGINAAGGNLGVGIVQFLVPVLVTVGALGALFGGGTQTKTASDGATSQVFFQNAAFFWVPLILLSAMCAYFFMNNLNISQAPPREQALVARRKHTWVMSYLYIGTFGSFIGYSASFPALITNVFPENLSLVYYAPLGPILGSLVRPVGGFLADKYGGARITFWNFIVMVVAVGGVLYFLSIHSFPGFLLMFLLLFITTGIGNGSTYRMIPFIFRTERERESEGQGEGVRAEAIRQGLKESAFVLGFAGAIAAYGGFIIPRAYGSSIEATGGPQTALACFIIFYVSCIAVTWWFYCRRNAEIPC
jgi:NNP family nitrate/nitrite transporter-like MFS transporter